jgi:catechol 2,3-dioxygenase-like lactoylglutathione lyase family enzyme
LGGDDGKSHIPEPVEHVSVRKARLRAGRSGRPIGGIRAANCREIKMKQSIVHIALVVRDYDEAIDFYTKVLNFTLVEDTYQAEQDKRWVVVAPPGSTGTTLLLARASKPEQDPFIGNQAGGRVFLFLNSDDFWRDYNEMKAKGVRFVREPKEADYGTVAVFEDLYGNRWDLLQLSDKR